MDTNVIAYYLLGSEDFIEECREIWRSIERPVAPASWQPEFLNVLWLAVRKEALTESDALMKLQYARKLGIETRSVESLWEGALVRAINSGLSAYDKMFVELAVREEIPMLTFDSSILRTFPSIARRPRDLIG